MKKRLLLIFLAFLLLVLLLSLISCYRSCTTDLSIDQPYTKWETEDGSFVFYVDGNHQSFGTIVNNGEEQNVWLYWERGGLLVISPIKRYDGKDFSFKWDGIESRIDDDGESWKYYYSVLWENDKIVIKRKEATKFGIGQKLVLRRTGENLTPEEIEYPTIMLPEYYYLYEEYKDLLDWKAMTKDEIIEKYGPFDMYDDEMDCYYYVVESDELGNPQYLIEVSLNLRGRLITAILITSERS